MKLTNSQVRALFRLWDSGYNNPVRPGRHERRFFKDLCRMGYVEEEPSTGASYRITESGILRIENPAILFVKEVTES